jgi:hypothetical protein
MPSRRGYVAGYNAQAVVSPLEKTVAGRGGMLVTAADVTDAPDDHAQLLPMLDAAAETTGQRAAVSVADGGFFSAPVLAGCAERQQQVLMPAGAGPTSQPIGPYHKDHFTYEAAEDHYICPQGKVLVFAGIRQRKGRPPVRAYRAGAAVCRSCAAFGICTKDAHKGRLVEVTQENPLVLAQRALMRTQGLRRFLLRGKEQVRAEWCLLAAAFNLRTLARIWQQKPALFAS